MSKNQSPTDFATDELLPRLHMFAVHLYYVRSGYARQVEAATSELVSLK